MKHSLIGLNVTPAKNHLELTELPREKLSSLV